MSTILSYVNNTYINTRMYTRNGLPFHKNRSDDNADAIFNSGDTSVAAIASGEVSKGNICALHAIDNQDDFKPLFSGVFCILLCGMSRI